MAGGLGPRPDRSQPPYGGRCRPVPRIASGRIALNRLKSGSDNKSALSERRVASVNAATISTTGNEATAWHALAADDVVRRLNTNTQTGLDAAEIPQRLAKYGPNRLPET